jgi:hypothetical protein
MGPVAAVHPGSDPDPETLKVFRAFVRDGRITSFPA